MADYDFSGVDAISAPETQPTPPPSPQTSSGGYDFSGVDQVKDYETPAEQAKTIAEGLASGATLGGSKVAETKLLGVKPEDILGREEANPWESGLANVAGTAGLLGTTGGAGALLPEEAGALARIGAYGLEGAAIGGVNQAMDDWSQNKPLDASKIAASSGIGALLGAGGATIIEGLEGAPSTVNKVTNYINKWVEEDRQLPFNIGAGYLDNMKMAYANAGVDQGAFVNGLSDTLNDLRSTAAKAGYVDNAFNNAFMNDSGTAVSKMKVKDFFNNIQEPEHVQTQAVLKSFIDNATAAAQLAQNSSTYTNAAQDIVKELHSHLPYLGINMGQADILAAMRNAQHGGGLGIFDLILAHALPPQILAPIETLKRYATSGGSYRAGVDLQKALITAKELAEKIAKATQKIDNGAAGIFRRSVSAETRKANE